MFAIARRGVRLSRRLWGHRLGSARGNRILAAIDFDRTIVEHDSYLAVSELLPADKRTKELKDMIRNQSWLAFIVRVLELVHCEYKKDSPTRVSDSVRRLQAVPGMLRVLRRLSRHPSLELCIVSDSNSFFICQWLMEYAIEHLFQAVYTNPACVQASGEVLVLPYEDQTHCNLCPANLCKGNVLQELICSGRYSRVVFIGDSCNDLCAMKRLREGDVACIRRGLELDGKMAAHGPELNCSVISWRNGHELEDLLLPQILK
ncbi:hypothetical protein KR009_008310 [Drosophila setifemur]|nr:hypothetical protein KR009_008310 [Drosophila setifemur]